MINMIITCLLITSLLLLVLDFWRNGKASINKKLITTSIITAVSVLFIISNAEKVGEEINNTKNIISDTAESIQKAVIGKTVSIFNVGKDFVVNTAESVRTKSIENLRAIITGDKKVADDIKEENKEESKQENKEESEVENIKAGSESEIDAVTQKKTQTEDIKNISVNYVAK